ncbi:MAG: hypothetical protein PHQ58_04530 [Rhodoferax sp.]|uniref:hypothetical protein n=1 Tax=Rhodoferax sp. TaxID=50421 RepID=UPI002630A2F2|nr:hypothetical protein [Rhodoferax sp.]MDD2879682.1 hypothetical protein [Rhodoferax sp.]
MHYKTNRQNHDFQIAYFLAGSCHTPDGAYALMCDLYEDRDNAIRSFEASKLREQAKIVRAHRLINSPDEAEQLEGKADLVEIEAMKETVQRNLDAAIAERATIKKCMDRLEPLRKYAHLSLPEAHQAAQQEEWKLELMKRAENYLLSQNGIPADHFATMRLHPDFKDAILPKINSLVDLLASGNRAGMIELMLPDAEFSVPKLMAS